MWPRTLGCRTTTTLGLWADRRTRPAAEVFASGAAVPGGVAAVAASAAAVGAAAGGAAVAVAGCGDVAVAGGVGSGCDGGTERRRTAGARAGTGCTRERPRTRSCADKRRRRRISRAAVPSVWALTSPASSSPYIVASTAETAVAVEVRPPSATTPPRRHVGRRLWTVVAGTTALFRRSSPAASICHRRSGRPTAAAAKSARLPSISLVRRVPPPLPRQHIRSPSSRSSPAVPPPSRDRPTPSARSLLSSFEFVRCDANGRYTYMIGCKTKTYF